MGRRDSVLTLADNGSNLVGLVQSMFHTKKSESLLPLSLVVVRPLMDLLTSSLHQLPYLLDIQVCLVSMLDEHVFFLFCSQFCKDRDHTQNFQDLGHSS